MKSRDISNVNARAIITPSLCARQSVCKRCTCCSVVVYERYTWSMIYHVALTLSELDGLEVYMPVWHATFIVPKHHVRDLIRW